MDLSPNPTQYEFDAQDVENILSFKRDFIDTKDLCQKILAELTGRSISQELFAARIINRSQGTLSDLLHKPKPWHVLQAGRQTYTRMFNWMNLPEVARMAILYGQPVGEVNVAASTPSQKNQNKRKSSSDQGEYAAKKQRLVFTDVQKSTLERIFEESQRPSKEMQRTIAGYLQLDISTVSNYFVNARRRAKAAQERNSLQ